MEVNIKIHHVTYYVTSILKVIILQLINKKKIYLLYAKIEKVW